MKTLYLNTSTPFLTVALYDRNIVIASEKKCIPKQESEQLLPLTKKILEKKDVSMDDIDQVLVCRGPGGFTSTRIGVSAVNAIAFGKNIPSGSVTVFDLFPQSSTVVIAANTNEAWIKFPGHPPQFFHVDTISLPKTFSFSGILNSSWENFLYTHGGQKLLIEESLPHLKDIAFHRKIIKPWYYKEAHITWSKACHSTLFQPPSGISKTSLFVP